MTKSDQTPLNEAAAAAAGKDDAAASKPPPPSPAPAADKPVEIGGPKGPEPTRYGDWEQNGRCTDF